MGLITAFIKGIVKHTLILAIIATIIIVIPNLPPYSKFSTIELEPTLPRTGPLAPNTLLNNPNKLYLNKVLGPENFQVYKGEVYTSLATGEIVKLSAAGHVTFVTKLGQPCTGLSQEHICGRPLGFVIDDKTGLMYVADAYLGIWQVNIKTDSKKLLVSPRVAIEGKVPKIFNSVALAKNGDLYWTDSSSDFSLQDGVLTLLADPTGRLFHYNAAKNKSIVLLNDIWFANGLAISPDGQFVIVAETFKFRLMKYYIDGPRKGDREVFVAGLPGTPDNVRPLPDGSGALVGLYTSFDDENPLLLRSLAQTPAIRKLAARIIRLIEIPFEFLNSHYPHFLLDDIVYYLGNFKSMGGLTPQMSGLVQIDWNGNVVASYYNTDGSLTQVSDAIVHNNQLLIGSPNKQNFVGSVPAPPLLKKAFGSTASQKEVPKVEKPAQKPVPKPAPSKPTVAEKKEVPKVAKPVTEPPKPTTTPPPPKTTTPPPPKPTTTPPPKTTPPPPKTTTPPPPKTTTPPPPKTTTPPPTKATPPPKHEKPKPQETKTTTKPSDTKPKIESKPVKPAEPKKEQAPPKPAGSKPTPEQIPIKEDIPSDTAKPSKEKLKVIKKEGPTEIPNPSL